MPIFLLQLSVLALAAAATPAATAPVPADEPRPRDAVTRVTLHPGWAEVERTILARFDEHGTEGWSPEPGRPYVFVSTLGELPPGLVSDSLRVSTPTAGAGVASWLVVDPAAGPAAWPGGWPSVASLTAGVSVLAWVADQARIFDIAFVVTHATNAAGWRPEYRACWNEPEDELDLLTRAVIVQRTGESWDCPVVLDEARSSAPAGFGGRRVELGRMRLDPDRERRVELPLERLPVRRSYTVRPASSNETLAFAVVRGPAERALEPGPLSLLVDGEYRGHVSLPAVAAGAEVRLPLGPSDALRASRVASTPHRRGGRTTVRLSVRNTSAAPVEVRVEEPLAAHRRVLSASRGWTREGGVVSWLRRLEPGETCRLRLRHAAQPRGGR